MANYKWPNVYPSIQDLSGVVATNSTTACAFVGESEFGPINQPILLSSLKDYTNRFGALDSRYGYAGYSLAVASEAVSGHYFVRVVNAGKAPHDLEKDARYASVKIPKKGGTYGPAQTGWFVEEVAAAVNEQDSGVFFTSETTEMQTVPVLDDKGQPVMDDETNQPKTEEKEVKKIVPDMDNAMIVVAADPNNRTILVTLTDSTINENRAYPISACVVTQDAQDANKYGVKLTITTTQQFKVGETIAVSKMSVNAYNGTFEITEVTPHYETANVQDSVDVSYVINVEDTETFTTEPTFTSARAGQYPEPDQTTFTVNVYQKVGRVVSRVESFEYCTLYYAKDNYGNSTFVEDVINGSSNYIQVFVNPNLLNSLSIDEVLQPQFNENEETFLELDGGFGGAKATSDDLNAGWEAYRDRTQTSVSLLVNAGYVSEGDYSYQSKMLEIADHRRDCFCLFDIPVNKIKYDDAIDWRKNVQGFNTYRGALSSPWIKTFDSVQGRSNFIMCPSAFMAKLICAAGDPWNAPAGPNRGTLASSTVSPTGLTQTYTDVEGGILYADNQINCMIRDAASGYVNWGQRTLQQKPSALDRINVARTIIYIETILRDAARWHLFENNTAYERMQITLQFSSFLDSVLSAGGIQSYSVICDESNNTPLVIGNNQLVIDIVITPTYTAESIILTTTVTGADASVTVSSSQG